MEMLQTLLNKVLEFLQQVRNTEDFKRWKEQRDKKEKQGKILGVATQILSSDIQNGLRREWLYEYSASKLDSMVEISVRLAKRLLDEVEKRA